MFKKVAIALTALILGSSASLAAPSIDDLLARESAPPGVVFEIVTSQESALETYLPKVLGLAEQLRERFPKMPLVVLTHGSEQFSLAKSRADEFTEIQKFAAKVDSDHAIPVEVCGNHARYRGVAESEFPNWIDVVESAGTQLEQYRSKGWKILLM